MDTRQRTPALNLAPFIAWLASRVADEPSRRRCRQVAEAYLDWSWNDGGPESTRKARFLSTAVPHLGMDRAEVERGLERLSEHRAVVARTVPDGR